jgi:signal transduction histidine kinase
MRDALARGFDGMRANGDEAWLTPRAWNDFLAYEDALQARIEDHPLLLLCAYPMEGRGAAAIFDVARKHETVLARRGDRWEVLETEQLASTKRELDALRAHLEQRVDNRTRELRQAHDRLQALTRRLIELKEAERRNLANELHDRVGQTLTAMRINMDMIRIRLDAHDDAEIRKRNDDSLELIASAFKAVENVMYELHPPGIEEHGLIAPLRWHATKFTQRTCIPVEIRGRDDRRHPVDAELAMFRIAQEALTNVARHSGARRVIVELRDTGREVLFTIEDDGNGFERERLPPGKGYGMSTMRERASAIGGTLEVHSERDRGTRITVRVPQA